MYTIKVHRSSSLAWHQTGPYIKTTPPGVPRAIACMASNRPVNNSHTACGDLFRIFRFGTGRYCCCLHTWIFTITLAMRFIVRVAYGNYKLTKLQLWMYGTNTRPAYPRLPSERLSGKPHTYCCEPAAIRDMVYLCHRRERLAQVSPSRRTMKKTKRAAAVVCTDTPRHFTLLS